MRTIRQPDRAYVYTLSAQHPPIASVACRESVLIKTIDDIEGRLTSAEDLYSRKCLGPPRVNPQTAPISIEGAEPGDTLVVHIERIEPAEAFAVTVLIPEFGGLAGIMRLGNMVDPNYLMVAKIAKRWLPSPSASKH